MKKITRNWFRRLAQLFSLTTIAFVFQACYGVPNKEFRDVKIKGTVLNKNGDPISGVKVTVNDYLSKETDAEGVFTIYFEEIEQYNVNFADTDKYIGRDTIIPLKDRKEILFNFVLDNK